MQIPSTIDDVDDDDSCVCIFCMYRHRAFSWLFSEGESEELNASQTVDSHCFPQHFMESKEKLGLAPAAVVLSRRGSYDAPWKSNDLNKRPRSSTPIIG